MLELLCNALVGGNDGVEGVIDLAGHAYLVVPADAPKNHLPNIECSACSNSC